MGNVIEILKNNLEEENLRPNLEDCQSIEAVVKRINKAGVFANLLAAEYAIDCIVEEGSDFWGDEAICHLEFLSENGADFDMSDAMEIAIKINSGEFER